MSCRPQGVYPTIVCAKTAVARARRAFADPGTTTLEITALLGLGSDWSNESAAKLLRVDPPLSAGFFTGTARRPLEELPRELCSTDFMVRFLDLREPQHTGL